MDVANQVGGFVVGTGDLSELALGWCTYNGDHMSMYHVNAGVPKTLVRYLVDWAADAEFTGEASAVLHDICRHADHARSCCRWDRTASWSRRPKTRSAPTSCTTSSCIYTVRYQLRRRAKSFPGAPGLRRAV